MFYFAVIFNCYILDCNYELHRDQVELGEIIGEGQFGDVHKGACHMRSIKNKPGNAVAVAIKTCKPDADMATTDKFLEEACKCLQSNHSDYYLLVYDQPTPPNFNFTNGFDNIKLV